MGTSPKISSGLGSKLGPDLRPEQRIVLLLSRLSPSAEAMAEAVGLLTSPSVDYGLVLEYSAMNDVSSFLYRNLKAYERDLPPDFMEALRNTYLFTAGLNAQKTHETLRILGLLRVEGIEAMPLKGSLASEVVMGDAGLYPSGDIDILVRPGALFEAEEVLSSHGYAREVRFREFMLKNNYHTVMQSSRYVVELHWNLAKKYFRTGPDFWWEEAVTVKYGGEELTLPSPERYVMHTAFRLLNHGFERLRHLVLTAEIINANHGDMDWARLMRLSEHYGMGRLMRFTLCLLGDLLGARVPGHVLDKRPWGYSLLASRITDGLFVEQRRRVLRHLYSIYLVPPANTLRVLAGRALPSAEEIRLRYGLKRGSGKVALYYVFNPLLLPVMMMRKTGK